MAQEREHLPSAKQCSTQKPGRCSGLFVVCTEHRQGGFTITELIVTVVMIGILAAVVLPRWGGETGFEERGFRDETASALRYAQKSAIALRRPVCAIFGANQLTFRVGPASDSPAPVNCDPDWTTTLRGPNGAAAYVLSAPAGVTYTAAPARIIFQPLGSVTASASITVSGLPATLTITVEQETGYVR